ncbi:efflux RND transporter periplasmic adaptor subunit [Shewanella surugensis]|uniref:Efflux RND transporter periplasmic adaptor subunit n=1 Tax=Shewanella surugensis TaxID=212020 RepID=A0ABT0LHH9_9GAMM|nr:efflux RND transporter periplasmic adaptor subunit [Shewanella surugensis]MCL1126915.1 efflux RND transporter periplasmic adaptor subunit [Shewanella surugensis]
MKKWFLVMIIIALLVFGSVIGFNLFIKQKIASFIANMPEAEFPVTAISVKPTTWQPNLHAIGYVEPNQGGTLSNQDAGVVASINFENGAAVKKGQLLLSLNTGVEKANLDNSVVQLPAAKADYERNLALYKQNSVSKQDVDTSQSTYLALIASIESLKATISRREIRAPFDGVMGIREVNLGDYLSVGTDIVGIEDLTDMKIRFTIPQTQLSKVFVGQKINTFVDSYPKIPFSGTITAIEPAVFEQSGLIQIQAKIPNADNKLRNGMFAEVDILLPIMKNQIVLPRTAITYTLYGNSIYLIENKKEKNETIQRVNQIDVQVLERSGGKALITGKLKAGDRIVTSGQVRLSNNSKVKVTESEALPTPVTMPQL